MSIGETLSEADPTAHAEAPRPPPVARILCRVERTSNLNNELNHIHEVRSRESLDVQSAFSEPVGSGSVFCMYHADAMLSDCEAM